MIRSITLFLIILAQLDLIQAQSPITFHANLGVNNYLKDRQINKIDRDESGYFWLLENSVLQKYDGRYVSENIPHPINKPKYFKCMKDNMILIVSHSLEVYFFDIEESSLTEVDIQVDVCEGCQLIDINLIEDTLYFHFKKSDIIKVFQTQDAKDFQWVTDFNLSDQHEIQNLFFLQEQLLVLTKKEEAFLIRDNSSTKLEVSEDFREITDNTLSNYITKKDLFFSFPTRLGVYRIQNGKPSIFQPDEKLVFAKKDRKGKILLASSQSFLHSENTLIIDKEQVTKWPELALINNTFIDAYVEDVDDKLLLGSHTGLFFVDMKTPGVEGYHQAYNVNNGFGNVIMSFTQLPNGEILYAKENKGIFRFEGKHHPEELPVSSSLLNNLNIHYDTFDEQIWISGYTNQRQGILYEYNPISKEVKDHKFEYPVMYFQRLNESEFLISSSITTQSYLFKYDVSERRIIDTLLSSKNERTRRFELYDTNEVLLSSDKRLLLLNIDNGAVRDILPDIWVQTIVKISTGYAACTIGHGIYFLDNDLNIIKVVNESNGLTNNQIYSIVEDQKGRFWVGTGNGLNVLDSELNYIKSYRQYDGLSSYELNTNSTILLDNGNLLFGTINGVTEIKPDLALSTPESAVLNVSDINYTDKGSKISQKVFSEVINLPEDAIDIIFTLEQNDFYKYGNFDTPISPRIQTFPEETNYEVRDNKLLIPQLSAKETKINIFPSDPLKTSEKISLQLTQSKDYTNLILLISIIALVGLLSYLITRRIIKFNNDRERERRENEVRMAELELQALRSQMNPHFIFNSLGAILLYLQTHENKKAEKYLTKFAKLMRMFLESSKSKFISYAEEKELLRLYLELEKLRFEKKFDYKIQIDDRIDQNTFTIPSMLLQPFVENAINHGLYHKKGEDGLLEIIVVPDGEKIKIMIRDNGVGREKAGQIKAESVKQHKSRATEIIQERMSVMKKEQNIDIDIQYNDLKSEDDCAMGTEVIITLPKIMKSYD